MNENSKKIASSTPENELIECLRCIIRNEFDFENLSNTKLSLILECNRHLINTTLKKKSRFTEFTIIKFKNAINNKLKDKNNLNDAMNALSKYCTKLDYIKNKNATNRLEIEFIDELKQIISNHEGKIIPNVKLGSKFGNRKLFTNALNNKSKLSDATLSKISRYIISTLKNDKHNLNLASSALSKYRLKRGEIFDKQYRKAVSKRMKNRWQNKNFRNKMKDIHKSEDYRIKLKIVHNSPKVIKLHSKVSKKRWEHDEYRAKMENLFSSNEFKQKTRDASKKRWNDDVFKEKMHKIQNSKDYKQKMSKAKKISWKNPKKKQNLCRAMKIVWENEDYYEKMMKILKSPQYRQKKREIMNKLYKNPEYKKNHLESILRAEEHPAWNPNRDEVLQPYGPDFFYNRDQQISDLYIEQCGIDAWSGKPFKDGDLIVRHHIKYVKKKCQNKDLVLITNKSHGKIHHPPHLKSENDKLKMLRAKINILKGIPPDHWSKKSKELFKQRKMKQSKLDKF